MFGLIKLHLRKLKSSVVKLEHFRARSEKTKNDIHYSKLLAKEEDISDLPSTEQ
jgi:hypothetical protein